MFDLTGRTVLVAGGSRGIGAATARLAAESGARVVVHGRSRSEAMETLLAGLAGDRDHLGIAADGRDAGAVAGAVAGLEVDALVCTLGSVQPTPALGGSTEDWVEDFRANVLGPAHFVRAVAPGMVARGRGRIALVSSIRGHDTLTSPDVTGYSAAKAAVENLTVSFAKELAPAVTVNAVAPGFVLTDMSGTWTDAVRAQVGKNLLGRAARPEEIAAVLLFLISDSAAYVTGQTLLADGGLEARAV